MTTTDSKAIMCITNQMHDFRSCTHRGAHTVNCDGGEYAWNEKRDREESTGRECKGCRPREARNGHMCLNCYEHVVNAMAEWGPFEEMIDGIDRAVQRDNGGISGQSLGYVPIPGTVLAVDEIWSYVKTMSGSIDQWVSTVVGAKDARRFARALEGALRTHAVEEKAHAVKRTRCTECKQLTLVYNPTVSLGGNVIVKCSNPACQHEMDQDSFDKIAAIEKPGIKISIRLPSGRDEFAEAYDPQREDHADLDPLTILTKAELQALLPEETPRLKYLRRAELLELIHDLEDAA